MKKETKIFSFEVKEVDEEEGIFTGYAATFSKTPDSYGDIIDKGAFKKTLKEGAKRIKILWNHRVLEPIGKPLEMFEDEKGLYVKGKLSLGVQRGKEILSLMKDGVITELSIGYDTVKESWAEGIRHLQEVRLWDFSPVTFAANPEATITDVKTEDEKAGRVLSTSNLEKVKKLLETFQSGIETLQALLESAEKEPEPDKSTLLSKEAEKEAAELEQIVTMLKAENEGFDAKKAEGRIEAILVKMRK